MYIYLPFIFLGFLGIIYFLAPAYLLIPIVLIIILLIIYYFSIWSKSQIFGYFPSSIKTDKKIISLTFDDGPNPPYTEELLKILARHKVQATFFMPGKNMERFPETVRKVFEAGHIIANHSYSHKFINNFFSLSFEKEISRAQSVIEQIIGHRPALYRSPWLFKQAYLLKNLKKHQLTPVSGFFISNWENWPVSAKKLARDAVQVARPGRILIFHDGFDTKGRDRSVLLKAVDIFISDLHSQGYQFVNVDKLLGVPAYQNKPSED